MQERKRPKIPDFDEGRMVSDHILPRPSQFAIGKLKSFNFVELWYFTDEGCREAQDSSRAQSDDAYGLTKVDDLVALKPVASFKASRNVIPDADLTWRQLNVAKNALIRYMEICNWPQKHIQSIAHFYFNLKLDPMRARPNGERVLIIYQAKVRRQWHDELARGQGFNIAQINQKLLSAVAGEVWDTVRTEVIRKLDAIALSPAQDRDRGRSRITGHSSPSKRPQAQSPSHSRSHSQSHSRSYSKSHSRSHSPPRHRQRRYISPHSRSHSRLHSQSHSRSHSPPRHRQCRYNSPNNQGRRGRLASSAEGRGKGSGPSFFRAGTAESGSSPSTS